MEAGRGDGTVQGREVDNGMLRSRRLLDEKPTAVETRRLRGRVDCPLVKKVLKLQDQGVSPEGLWGGHRQGEWALGPRRVKVEGDLIVDLTNFYHPGVHSPSLPSQPEVG